MKCKEKAKTKVKMMIISLKEIYEVSFQLNLANNLQNLLHVDRFNCAAYNSSAKHSNEQKSDSSYNLSRYRTAINAISALRSGRILSHSKPIKSKEIENNEPMLEDKLEDRELILEKEELNREGKEQMIPFPSALASKKEKIDNSSLLEVLKNTFVTIPLTNAIHYIPLYGKVVKELCSPSRERRKIKLSENISSIILNSLPEKLQDLRAPVIGCIIQNMEFKRVFLDTGASVKILPKLLYDKLSLVALEPIKLELQLADGSARAPYGRLEDVIAIVGDLAFLEDFIVTDVKIIRALCNAPIILGRPFLATARAITDFDKGNIELRVGNDKLEIPIPNLRRIPEYTYEDANRIDQFLEEEIGYDELIEEVFAINDSQEVDLKTLLIA